MALRLRLHADQLHLEPVPRRGPRKIVAQQRGRLIQVHDEDVDVAIVVEVAESAAAAGMRRGDAGPGFVDQLFEFALPRLRKTSARACGTDIVRKLRDTGCP